MQANPITPPLNPHEISFNHYSKPSFVMAKFQNLHGFIVKPSFKPMEIPMKLQHVRYFSWWKNPFQRAFSWWHKSHGFKPPFNHQIPAMKPPFGCVWKCCVPLNPMVLLIIIPMKNGYFIGKINPTFLDKPIFWWWNSSLQGAKQISPALAVLGFAGQAASSASSAEPSGARAKKRPGERPA